MLAFLGAILTVTVLASEQGSDKSNKPQCSWDSWIEQPCNSPCGPGTIARTRRCLCPTPSKGKPAITPDCPGSDRDSIWCDNGPCCSWGAWGNWTNCTNGFQSRNQSCECKAGSTGKPDCSGPQPMETRACCSWSAWSEYGGCTANCGGGQQVRSRDCVCGIPADFDYGDDDDCDDDDDHKHKDDDDDHKHKDDDDKKHKDDDDKKKHKDDDDDKKHHKKRRIHKKDDDDKKHKDDDDKKHKDDDDKKHKDDDDHKRRNRYASLNLPNYCTGSPVQLRPCNTQSCCSWGNFSFWSNCSNECGGVRRRYATCNCVYPYNLTTVELSCPKKNSSILKDNDDHKHKDDDDHKHKDDDDKKHKDDDDKKHKDDDDKKKHKDDDDKKHHKRRIHKKDDDDKKHKDDDDKKHKDDDDKKHKDDDDKKHKDDDDHKHGDDDDYHKVRPTTFILPMAANLTQINQTANITFFCNGTQPFEEQICRNCCVWNTWSNWTQCDKSCGGVQYRRQLCSCQGDNSTCSSVYSDTLCSGIPLTETRSCNVSCCTWAFIDNWTPCLSDNHCCGNGSQWRKPVCQCNGMTVPDSQCQYSGVPPQNQTRICSNAPCCQFGPYVRVNCSQLLLDDGFNNPAYCVTPYSQRNCLCPDSTGALSVISDYSLCIFDNSTITSPPIVYNRSEYCGTVPNLGYPQNVTCVEFNSTSFCVQWTLIYNNNGEAYQVTDPTQTSSSDCQYNVAQNCWDGWTDWSICCGTCANSYQYRRQTASMGESSCRVPPAYEYRPCNLSTPCCTWVYDNTTQFSNCSAFCGNGQQYRFPYTCSCGNSSLCPNPPPLETRTCNKPCCTFVNSTETTKCTNCTGKRWSSQQCYCPGTTNPLSGFIGLAPSCSLSDCYGAPIQNVLGGCGPCNLTTESCEWRIISISNCTGNCSTVLVISEDSDEGDDDDHKHKDDDDHKHKDDDDHKHKDDDDKKHKDDDDKKKHKDDDDKKKHKDDDDKKHHKKRRIHKKDDDDKKKHKDDDDKKHKDDDDKKHKDDDDKKKHKDDDDKKHKDDDDKKHKDDDDRKKSVQVIRSSSGTQIITRGCFCGNQQVSPDRCSRNYTVFTTQACTVNCNCTWVNISEWSKCSATCGGTRYRTRTCSCSEKTCGGKTSSSAYDFHDDDDDHKHKDDDDHKHKDDDDKKHKDDDDKKHKDDDDKKKHKDDDDKKHHKKRTIHKKDDDDKKKHKDDDDKKHKDDDDKKHKDDDDKKHKDDDDDHSRTKKPKAKYSYACGGYDIEYEPCGSPCPTSDHKDDDDDHKHKDDDDHKHKDDDDHKHKDDDDHKKHKDDDDHKHHFVVKEVSEAVASRVGSKQNKPQTTSNLLWIGIPTVTTLIIVAAVVLIIIKNRNNNSQKIDNSV